MSLSISIQQISHRIYFTFRHETNEFELIRLNEQNIMKLWCETQGKRDRIKWKTMHELSVYRTVKWMAWTERLMTTTGEAIKLDTDRRRRHEEVRKRKTKISRESKNSTYLVRLSAKWSTSSTQSIQSNVGVRVRLTRSSFISSNRFILLFCSLISFCIFKFSPRPYCIHTICSCLFYVEYRK